jgi:hypothetical protein
MGRAYYNEIDPHAAQWLRNLISANLIAPGHVDERDIRDISPKDLDDRLACWTEYRKTMHEMLATQAVDRLSEIFGAVAGRAKAALRRMPKGIREDLAIFAAGKPESHAGEAQGQGERISPSLRRFKQGSDVGEGGGAAREAEGYSVRPFGAFGRVRGSRPKRRLRINRNTVRLSFVRDNIQLAIAGQDSPDRGLYIREYAGHLLRYERGARELGRKGAARDDWELVSRERPYDGKSRAKMLRGYGNAIVAPLAAEFIRAAMLEIEARGVAE